MSTSRKEKMMSNFLKETERVKDALGEIQDELGSIFPGYTQIVVSMPMLGVTHRFNLCDEKLMHDCSHNQEEICQLIDHKEDPRR
jgi:hypothetical protein